MDDCMFGVYFVEQCIRLGVRQMEHNGPAVKLASLLM